MPNWTKIGQSMLAKQKTKKGKRAISGWKETTTMKRTKYQLLEGGKWTDVKRATTEGLNPGWLHWEDADGCTGLSRPGTWREKPQPPISTGRFVLPENPGPV